RQYVGDKVAAENNLQHQFNKHERLIIEGIVPAHPNPQSRTERLILDNIVVAKYDPKTQKDQTKLQFV
ncbi:unnamed protein product, partial [Adineta steineri]